ncbi:hypothetical protein THAOC_36483, partial [Thalassiosira oceanica]
SSGKQNRRAVKGVPVGQRRSGGSMNELRKRTRTGNDRVTGAPAAEAPELPKLAGDAAATKISELQAELEAIKQSHEAVVDKLNAKVDALQAKNESQLREIRDLTSALQWAYAVDGIPRRHWLEQGHSEDYADAMENLLNSMKQNIETLRLGGDCETIAIDFDLRSEDENWIRADHDELLLPYWKELAAALRHWSEYHAKGECLRVEIIYIELPKSVLDMLRPAFEQSRIKQVSLSYNRHNGDMADFAKKVLQANHFLTEVGFGDILSRRGYTHTLKFILGSIIAVSERDALLNLCDNGMSSQEAAIIAEFLNSNPSLTHLYLHENRFDDSDAAVLASPLSNNTQLRTISVGGNGMAVNGRLAFLRAVFDVSSLSACAASNHTCCVYGLERDISVLNRYIPTRNKWNKIFAMLALSSEDSFINISLLRGVPAHLIPMILVKCNQGFANSSKHLTDTYLELTTTTRSQKHDVWDSLGESKSLNCMYDLMRSWVVSSIFV